MDIRYQKDFNKSYLVMTPQEEPAMDSYSVRMLLGNEIDMLLPCKQQSVNGVREFLYDITGAQSVEAVYRDKKIGEEQLRHILNGFMKSVGEIQAYLLDVNQLVARPECMYMDGGEELRFCYLPGYQMDIRFQFRNFLEYLLPKIDHRDSQAVVLGYGIYRDSMKENFSLADIKDSLYRERLQEQNKKEYTQTTQEEQRENLRQKAMSEFFDGEDQEPESEREDQEKIPWDTIVTSAIWTIVLLGICVLRYMGVLSFLTMPMMLGIFILVLGILALNMYLWKRPVKSDGRMPEKWLQQDVAAASIQWPGKKVVESETVQQIFQEEVENMTTGRDPVKAVDDLGDTQPLPRIQLKSAGRLVSRDSDRYGDIELTGDLTILGKMKDAVDVVIPMPTISRIHGKIRRVDEEYYLMDLNSRNGTYINGEPLPNQENRRIQPGDEICFADVAYVFQA